MMGYFIEYLRKSSFLSNKQGRSLSHKQRSILMQWYGKANARNFTSLAPGGRLPIRTTG
jgi:hypothetical protein